jgi:O-antigen ligase
MIVENRGCNADKIVRVLFCCYFSTLYLSSISFVPIIINSVFLYSYLVVGFLFVLMRRSLVIGEYTASYAILMCVAILSTVLVGALSGLLAEMKDMFLCLISSVILSAVYTTEEHLENWMRAIIACAFVTMIWIVYTGQLQQFNRLAVTFTNSINAISLLYLFPFSSAVYLGRNSKSKKSSVLNYAFAILFFAFIAFLGSRTSLISAICFVLMFFLVSGDNRAQRFNVLKYVFFVSVFVVAFYFLIWKIPIFYEKVGSRIDGLLTTFQGGQGEFSANIRMEILEQAGDVFRRRPFLGFGLSGFQRATGLTYYTHNTFAEILCDFGIVGFVIYYSIVLKAILININGIKNRNMVCCFLLSAIIMILISELGTVDYALLNMQFIFIVSFSLINNKKTGYN